MVRHSSEDKQGRNPSAYYGYCTRGVRMNWMLRERRSLAFYGEPWGGPVPFHFRAPLTNAILQFNEGPISVLSRQRLLLLVTFSAIAPRRYTEPTLKRFAKICRVIEP